MRVYTTARYAHLAKDSLRETAVRISESIAGICLPDTQADWARGDAELLGGADEAPETGGGLEEAQAVEGRQGNHGFGREKR